MKSINLNKNLIIAALVAFSIQLSFAQTVQDSVVLGAGYTNQCFYQLSSGTKTYTTLSDWHLAFENKSLQSAGIWINEAIGVKAYLYPTGDTAAFGTALDTTGIATWPELHNSVARWDQGALNAAAAPPFDFGWGNYHQATNTVYGDSVYLLKLNDTTYYQFMVNTEDQNSYTFSFANLDGSSPVKDSVARVSSSAKNFGYYNLATQTASDPEPTNTDWELLFTTSLTTQQLAPGYFANSAGMVYTNYSLNTAAATGVDASTVDYLSQTLADDNITTIGDGYRYFDQMGSMSWVMTDSTAYFVEDQEGRIYKLVFTGFGGSTSGSISFSKTTVYDPNATTSINHANNMLEMVELYPNPAVSNLQLVVSAKETDDYKLSVYNMAGQEVWSTATIIESGLQTLQIPVENLGSGFYVLQMTNDKSVNQQKFVKH